MHQSNGRNEFEPDEPLIELEEVPPRAAHRQPPPLPVMVIPAIELCRACQGDMNPATQCCTRCGAQRTFGMAPLPAPAPEPFETINVFQSQSDGFWTFRTMRWALLAVSILIGFAGARMNGSRNTQRARSYSSTGPTPVVTGQTPAIPPAPSVSYRAITPRASSANESSPASFPPTRIIVSAPPGFQRTQTEMIGGTTGGGPFERPGRNNEPITGFRISTAQWKRKSIVRTLDPIYPSDSVPAVAGMIFAKPGYAVGGVYIDGIDHINAISILFMRIDGDALSTSDTYRSRWYGDHTSVDATLLGGQGERVVGIFGRKGMNVDALGLIVLSRLESASRE